MKTVAYWVTKLYFISLDSRASIKGSTEMVRIIRIPLQILVIIVKINSPLC